MNQNDIFSFFESKSIFFAYLLVGIVLLGSSLSYLLDNNLQGWDAWGHVESAKIASENWPNPVGWNSQYFNGFVQNYFYPPLLSWIVGTIGIFIPIDLAFKLVTVLIYFFAVPVFFFFSRIFYQKKGALRLTLVFLTLFFTPEFISYASSIGVGGTAFSLFVIGLVPSMLGILLLLVFLGLYEKNADKILLSFVFALGLLAHYVFLFVIFYLLLKAITQKQIRKSASVFFFGAMISAFWWLPAVANAQFATSSNFPLPVANLTSALVLLGFVSLFFRRKSGPENTFFALGAAIFIFAYFFTFLGGQGQLLRVFFFISICTIPLPLKVVSEIISSFLQKRETAQIANFLTNALPIFAAVLIFAFSLSIDLTSLEKATYTSSISKGDLSSQIVIGQTGSRSLFYELANEGGHSLRGLFTEQSANIKFITEMITFVNPYDRFWGAPRLEANRLTPLSFQYLVRLFGVGSIISTETIGPYTGYTNSQIIGEQKTKNYSGKILWFDANPKFVSKKIIEYHLQKSPKAEIVHSAPVKLDGSELENTSKVFEFAENSDVFLVAGKDNISGYTLNPQAKIKGVSFGRGSIKLKVDSATPVLILVKESYFPNWKAYINGKETKIYEAFPHLMLVVGSGDIELRFERTLLENIALILSVLAVLALFQINRKTAPSLVTANSL